MLIVFQLVIWVKCMIQTQLDANVSLSCASCTSLRRLEDPCAKRGDVGNYSSRPCWSALFLLPPTLEEQLSPGCVVLAFHQQIWALTWAEPQIFLVDKRQISFFWSIARFGRPKIPSWSPTCRRRWKMEFAVKHPQRDRFDLHPTTLLSDWSERRRCGRWKSRRGFFGSVRPW